MLVQQLDFFVKSYIYIIYMMNNLSVNAFDRYLNHQMIIFASFSFRASLSRRSNLIFPTFAVTGMAMVHPYI